MGLDRDELAARFAVALACGDIASDQPERAPVDVVAFRAFEYADAFLAESSKSSTPVLSPPAAVAPATPAPEAGLDAVTSMVSAIRNAIENVTGRDADALAMSDDQWTRVARAVLLRTTPAPEAKRPGWVRVTGPATASHVIDELVTIGKVYKVDGWVEDGSPRVIGNHGLLVALSRPDGSDCAVYSRWEPCDAPPPCPPPVAGSARYDVLAIKNAILCECPFDVRRKDLEDYHAMAIAKAVIAVLPEVRP